MQVFIEEFCDWPARRARAFLTEWGTNPAGFGKGSRRDRLAWSEKELVAFLNNRSRDAITKLKSMSGRR